MTQRSDETLRPLLDEDAYFQDLGYYARMNTFREALHTVDSCMDRAGVPDDERTVVLQTMVLGLPYAAVAHERIADRKKRERQLSTTARPVFIETGARGGDEGCSGCGNPVCEQGPDGTCRACADTLEPGR